MRPPRDHHEVLAREREAWDRLQHSREAETLDQRRCRLDEWLQAVRSLRETQAESTSHAVTSAMAGLRESVQRLASASAAETTDPGLAPAVAAVHAHLVPRHAERLRARDGTLWRVESVAIDLLDTRCFLAHVRRETPDGTLIDVIEIYSDDWPLHCLAYGLQPVAASGLLA